MLRPSLQRSLGTNAERTRCWATGARPLFEDGSVAKHFACNHLTFPFSTTAVIGGAAKSLDAIGNGNTELIDTLQMGVSLLEPSQFQCWRTTVGRRTDDASAKIPIPFVPLEMSRVDVIGLLQYPYDQMNGNICRDLATIKPITC